MKRQSIMGLLTVLAFVFGPVAAQARYLNPNTGRFWTMDSYEGNNQEPSSLHKYLYCHANPVNSVDPSGSFAIGEMFASLDIFSFFAQITTPVSSSDKRISLKLSDKSTTLGMIQRLLVAEVRLPGDPQYNFIDSECGLWGVGAVVVNRVKSSKFPNTIEGVIKQRGQFAGFENYPTIPQRIEKDAADLERFANSRGDKIVNYRTHMEELLDVARRVIKLDGTLDIYVPAGGPYTPTMYFRQENSGNPFNFGTRNIPEYRGTRGGNDFYRDR